MTSTVLAVAHLTAAQSTHPESAEPTADATAVVDSEFPPVPSLVGRWRLRLIPLTTTEVAAGGGDPIRDRGVGTEVRIAVDLHPNLQLSFGFLGEGLAFALRPQFVTRRGFELWCEGAAGFMGYSSLEGAFLGFGGGCGTSLIVNERFLVGPALLYTHEFVTDRRDRDYVHFGLQLDLMMARRSRPR